LNDPQVDEKIKCTLMGSDFQILHEDMGKRKICAKFVPQSCRWTKGAQSPHLWTLYHSTPDFTPANFFLFPKVKTVIKRFQQVKDITAKLNAINL